jgi:hypothetical protein
VIFQDWRGRHLPRGRVPIGQQGDPDIGRRGLWDSFLTKIFKSSNGEAEVGDRSVRIVEGVILCADPSLLEVAKVAMEPGLCDQCNLFTVSQWRWQGDAYHEEERCTKSVFSVKIEAEVNKQDYRGYEGRTQSLISDQTWRR